MTWTKPEELAEAPRARLFDVYGIPASNPRIARWVSTEPRQPGANDIQIWRIQLTQQTRLAYVVVQIHELLDLVTVLRTWTILPTKLPAPQGTTGLILFGGIVADVATLVGQSSVCCYYSWLKDMPGALGAFPPCPQSALEQAIGRKPTSEPLGNSGVGSCGATPPHPALVLSAREKCRGSSTGQ